MYTIEKYIDPSSPDRGPYPMVTLDKYYQALVELLGNERQTNFEIDRYLELSIEESAKERRPHVVGAGAECAGCLIMEVPFNPTIDTYRTIADAGKGEFRFDSGFDSGKATRVKKTDSDNSILISIGGEYPTYVGFGWAPISELRRRNKKEQFKAPNTKAAREATDVEFWVPRNTLLSLADLNRERLKFNSAEDRAESSEKLLEIIGSLLFSRKKVA